MTVTVLLRYVFLLLFLKSSTEGPVSSRRRNCLDSSIVSEVRGERLSWLLILDDNLDRGLKVDRVKK